VPELKVNGELVKSGNTLRLGNELDLVTKIRFPGRSSSPKNSYSVVAGSYLSINVIAGNISSVRLQNAQMRLEQTKAILESHDQAQIDALTREEFQGDLFYVGSLGYYAKLLVLGNLAGLAQGAHEILRAGYGTIGYEPKVNYFFGIPRAIQAGGVSFDIPYITTCAVNDGNMENRKQYLLKTGLMASALEHATPELMFASQDPNDPEPDAISAVKALQKAGQAGQRVYHITQANMASVLPNIHHDSSTMAEIRASLNAGKEVITHADAVSVPGWTGAGYIIYDPDVGDGAYKISGGSNGGFLVLAGMALAFLLVAALFFISTPILALIAGIAGFIANLLIMLSLQDDPSTAADYAIARFITLIGSFVLLVILTGTVFMVLPLLFILTVVFAMIAAIIYMIRDIHDKLSFRYNERSVHYYYV
jgi:hypothetical protein